jgi:hypothetical protein
VQEEVSIWSTAQWRKAKDTARGRRGGATTNHPRQKDNKSILLWKVIVQERGPGEGVAAELRQRSEMMAASGSCVVCGKRE